MERTTRGEVEAAASRPVGGSRAAPERGPASVRRPHGRGRASDGEDHARPGRAEGSGGAEGGSGGDVLKFL
jgi:hypothetical protein